MHTELEFRCPDLIHAVIGFRQWRMGPVGLLSIASNYRWEGAELVAECHAGRHPHAPTEDCTCGIYAWYRPCPRSASWATADYVAGAVAIWGHIELHATGMRAERARIVALELPLSPWRKRRRLLAVADALRVPAVPHRALAPVALRHGTLVPEALRPPESWARPAAQPIGVVPRLVSSATDEGW